MTYLFSVFEISKVKTLIMQNVSFMLLIHYVITDAVACK